MDLHEDVESCKKYEYLHGNCILKLCFPVETVVRLNECAFFPITTGNRELSIIQSDFCI